MLTRKTGEVEIEVEGEGDSTAGRALDASLTMDVPDSWLYEPPISETPAPQPAMSSSAPKPAVVDEVPPPPLTASELECAPSRPMTPTPLRVRRRRNHIRHQHPYRNDGSAPVMASQQPMESLARKLSQQTLITRRDQGQDSSECKPAAPTATPLTDSMQGLEPGDTDTAMDIDPVEADLFEPLQLPVPRSVEMMRRRRMLSRRQMSSASRGGDLATKPTEPLPEPIQPLEFSSRPTVDLAMKPIEPDSLPSTRTNADKAIEALDPNEALKPIGALDSIEALKAVGTLNPIEAFDPIEPLLPQRKTAHSRLPRAEDLGHLLPRSSINVADSIEAIEPAVPSRKPIRSLEALVMRPLPGTWRDYPPIEIDPKDGATLPDLEADEGFCDGADELSWLNDGGSTLAGPSRLVQNNGVLRFKRSSEAAMQCTVVVQKSARMRRRRQRKHEARSRASSTIPTSIIDGPDLPLPYPTEEGPASPMDNGSAERHLAYDRVH